MSNVLTFSFSFLFYIWTYEGCTSIRNLCFNIFSPPKLEEADSAISYEGNLETLTIQIAGNTRNYDTAIHKISSNGKVRLGQSFIIKWLYFEFKDLMLILCITTTVIAWMVWEVWEKRLIHLPIWLVEANITKVEYSEYDICRLLHIIRAYNCWNICVSSQLTLFMRSCDMTNDPVHLIEQCLLTQIQYCEHWFNHLIWCTEWHILK